MINKTNSSIKAKSSVWITGVFSLFACTQIAQAKVFVIDPTHSNVGFAARHMMSKVNGEFTKFSGELSYDPDHLEQGKVTATAEASSISTRDDKRDEHLKSDDFFAVKKFPKLVFESTKISKNGSNKYKMDGNLTMHGITHPVTFDVEALGEMDDPWGNHRAGFTAKAVVNRKDYSISWNKVLDKGGVMIGDDVEINLNIEATETKPQHPGKKTK
jgi:polyisoprenoid-binding protein YceI